MALVLTALTSGNSSTIGTVTTASISPSANALVVFCVSTGGSNGINVSAVAGNGITYTALNGGVYNGPKGSMRGNWVWYGLTASPSSGTVTFTNGTSVCCWSIFQIAGVPTTGTNGSGAIIQSATNSGTGVTNEIVTLSALANASNITIGSFGSLTTLTAGASFTQIHNVSATINCLTEYASPGNTSVNCTLSSSSIRGTAFEVGFPPSANSNAPLLMYFM